MDHHALLYGGREFVESCLIDKKSVPAPFRYEVAGLSHRLGVLPSRSSLEPQQALQRVKGEPPLDRRGIQELEFEELYVRIEASRQRTELLIELVQVLPFQRLLIWAATRDSHGASGHCRGPEDPILLEQGVPREVAFCG